jgi:hypothetical protein
MVSKQCREGPAPGVIDKAAFLGHGSEMSGVAPVSAGALLQGSSFLLCRESCRAFRARLQTFSLDLFAVLFGGVTALLPIYARDILAADPSGLGILRGASVGALLVTALLARHTLHRHTGLRMFQAVIVFGAATAVFALSHWMWLSVLALALLGAADTVSVVIRFALVAIIRAE